MFNRFTSLINLGSKSRPIISKISTNLNDNNSYSVHKIELKTCGKLYERLKRENKLYENSPNDGLKVNIEYADTYCTNKNNLKPVIVGLHGVPGSHQDFSHLIKYFDSKGYRVIVPNFPGFELTRETQSYWHSAEEKAQLVRDLLTELGVKQVDCLICHSGGLFPASFLWSEPSEMNVKSVALFNTPSSAWIGSWQIIFTKFFSKLISYNQNLLSHSPGFFAKLFGYPVTGDNDQLMEGALMSANCRFETLDQRFNYLRDNRIPTLFLMTESDSLIKKQYFFDFINTLSGVRNKNYNYSVFDGNKTNVELVSSNLNNDHSLHVINIRPAGHYAFIKYPDIVNSHIENLIKCI